MLTFSQFDHLSDELVSGDHRWLDVPGVVLVPCRVRQVSDSSIPVYMQPSRCGSIGIQYHCQSSSSLFGLLSVARAHDDIMMSSCSLVSDYYHSISLPCTCTTAMQVTHAPSSHSSTRPVLLTPEVRCPCVALGVSCTDADCQCLHQHLPFPHLWHCTLLHTIVTWEEGEEGGDGGGRGGRGRRGRGVGGGSSLFSPLPLPPSPLLLSPLEGGEEECGGRKGEGGEKRR